MFRLGSLATALTLILLVVPTLSAQEPPDRSMPGVDCDSICLIFPDQAPAECACGIDVVTGGTGGATSGGGTTVADPAAAALIEKMQAAFREATAGIENYTLIEVSWASGVQLGPPAPLYYEMTDVDGEPVPRQVPQDELAHRQAVASGQPTPDQVASGLSDMFRILGEGIGDGHTPTDEGEATFIDLFNAVAATGIAQDAAHELDNIVGEMASADEDNLVDRLMDMKELGERLRLRMSQPCETFPGDDILERASLVGLQCLELGANAEDLSGLDLGVGWKDSELMEVKVVIAGTRPAGSEALEKYTCLLDCHLIQEDVQTGIEPLTIPLSTTFVVKTRNGPVKIQRSATAADVADSRTPFIPRRTQSKIIGIRGLQEITTEVFQVIPNEGWLDSDRTAQEVYKVLQQIQNN